MASIEQAQASALADGFLDSIGSDRTGLQPRNTISEMMVISGEFIEDAQSNLIRSNKHSSGELSASLVAENPQVDGSVYSVDIKMLYYGLFVNAGVKGTKSGRSTAGYSFKYDMPSAKMIQAIQKWINAAQISTRSVKRYSGHGAHEIKNKTISQAGTAFAIARSVKQKGLKPTGFLDDAAKTARQKIADRLGAALSIDIITSLQNEP